MTQNTCRTDYICTFTDEVAESRDTAIRLKSVPLLLMVLLCSLFVSHCIIFHCHMPSKQWDTAVNYGWQSLAKTNTLSFIYSRRSRGSWPVPRRSSIVVVSGSQGFVNELLMAGHQRRPQSLGLRESWESSCSAFILAQPDWKPYCSLNPVTRQDGFHLYSL